MLTKVIKFLFSMKMMVIELLIFAYAIGKATFIESNFGTPASKIAVYNARWFEFLLFHLFIILIVNLISHKTYKKYKWPTFMFHVSFLIIIIGAGLTRYIGFEGQMRIKNGDATNVIYSSTPYLTFKANDLVNQFEYHKDHWLSEGVENPFKFSFQLPNHEKVKVEYVSFKEHMIDTLMEAEPGEGKNALEFMIRGQRKYVFQGEQGRIGDIGLSFEGDGTLASIRIAENDGQLFVVSDFPYNRVDMTTLSMEDRATGNVDSSAITLVKADTLVPFIPMNLYEFGGESIVYTGFKKNVKKTKVKSPNKKDGDAYLTMKLSTATESTLVEINGEPSVILSPGYFRFAGMNFEVGYGAKPIELPFYVKCNQFKLDKYPGSDMASSYASDVTVIDSARNVVKDHHIFMNHFMDYGKYRFFQSSYFPDESGTILSVNYDWWGKIFTYIGYFLMCLGMVASVFNPKGRVAELNSLIRKSRDNRMKMLKTVALIFGVGIGVTGYAQSDDTTKIVKMEHRYDNEQEKHNQDIAKMEEAASHVHQKDTTSIPIAYLTEEQAELWYDLLIQDYDGRIIPYHTLADKLMRKIERAEAFEGKNPVQVITSMQLYGPKGWNSKRIIFVPTAVRERLGLDVYASVNDLEDEMGSFKWMDDYKESHEKSDGQKNEFDKQMIKLGERYRVMKAVMYLQYFRVVPISADDNGKWTWPFDSELGDEDFMGNALTLNLMRNSYLLSNKNGLNTNDPEADTITTAHMERYLTPLKEYQWTMLKKYEEENPNAHKLTQKHVEIEIAYNKMNPFGKILKAYLITGILLLLLFFIRTLLTPTKTRESVIRKVSAVLLVIVGIAFIFHGIALGMRWYITGHAPWSDGYEAVVFIAWATILGGLFFVKKNPAIIAATTLLAALMVFVTQLNLFDPEITPLEPVLKSYWLMIHVAVITSSYGFLGISCMLGILNILLYLFKTKKNKKRLQMNINELSAASEIVMIVGLFMLSMGTFLGGVWANESWGRYWGWDPKEVWALVSMLVYATIIHLRWIPKLNDKFLFNVLGMWGYAAIMFTFFGVNFVLVGLHSYAQGDGVGEWPTSVIVSTIAFVIYTIIATIKYLYDKKAFKVN